MKPWHWDLIAALGFTIAFISAILYRRGSSLDDLPASVIKHQVDISMGRKQS